MSRTGSAPLTFTLKINPLQRVDCSPLTPDNLKNKSASDIAALELHYGRQKLRADMVFAIAGIDTNHIIIKNSSAKLDYIGHNMKIGQIKVHGDVGSFLGFQMSGGAINLHGNADAFAASGLSGGMIHIHGNVGDFLGGAIPGLRKGMKGGTVIVTGNAGDRTGDQMRRGVLLIEGNVGDYCASRMLAGTIGVLGTAGNYIGYGMRHGTLLLAKKPVLHVTMQDCGLHTLPFLNLLCKSFGSLPTKFAKIATNRVQRYAGDIAYDGKGEILVLV